jgi:hypothetical protein
MRSSTPGTGTPTDPNGAPVPADDVTTGDASVSP